MFSRLAKFSFDVFSFLVHLPFHILMLGYMAVAAVTFGAVGGFIMAAVCPLCGFSEKVGWMWALPITGISFTTMVYRHFVVGDRSDT